MSLENKSHNGQVQHNQTTRSRITTAVSSSTHSVKGALNNDNVRPSVTVCHCHKCLARIWQRTLDMWQFLARAETHRLSHRSDTSV